MNVHAVIVIDQNMQGATELAITAQFPGNFLKVASNVWFVASSEFILDVAKKLGVKSQEQDGISNIILLPVPYYWGHGNVSMWQWLKSKIEEKANAPQG